MEIEKMEIEHRHKMELKDKDMQNQLGTEIVSNMMKEYLHSPSGQSMIRAAGRKKH